MINTGATLMQAALTLHEKGAKSVHVVISHGMLVFRFSLTHPPTNSLRASFRGQYEPDRRTTYHRVGGMCLSCMVFETLSLQ